VGRESKSKKVYSMKKLKSPQMGGKSKSKTVFYGPNLEPKWRKY
jgi:hypothetical protein